MNNDVPIQSADWKSTKEAVANFRQLLLCSKCTNLMKEPVCLGMCEHMLCRSCAGPRAGDGCVVCQSPAWVKDIQINRQLSSIVQLFCGLESLLHPVEQQASSGVEIQTLPESPVFKNKKNFKIWFSPSSRKVRCTVEKTSGAIIPNRRSPGETDVSQPETIITQHQNLSVFNFTSSSEESSFSSQKCTSKNIQGKKRSNKKKIANWKASVQGATRTTRTQIKQMMTKKKRLAAVNHQWGLSDEVPLKKQELLCDGRTRRSTKRVSFLSSAVDSERQPEVPKESTDEFRPDSSATQMNCPISDGLNMSDVVIQPNSLSSKDLNPTGDPEKQADISPPMHSSKRARVWEKVGILETTPKRPRTSTGQRRKSLNQMSPVVLNPPFLTSPKCKKNTKISREEQGHIPVCRKSSPHSAPVAQTSAGSPAVIKRNHKGETLLHLAAIKGDVDTVNQLLDQGADPNLKDNAGWTPLHEACNLGHMAVVEVLVSRGALLNTPGYENDSPLHDAVRNSHPAIVKLLLQHGASRNVLNLHGKQPADYAVSLEMLKIFHEASEGTQYANASFSPSAGPSVVSDCMRRNETLVFLASKLSQQKLLQLAKLGELLGGRVADTFSGSVSHVVVPEGPMPTTYSTLLGLLAGCWVVRYSWVEACLQADKWMPETEHEAGEGPQRSRVNRCSLLPPLFDGCFFFFLGSFKAPTKDELTKLLREGGGQLLSRQPKPDSDVTQTLSAAAYHALPGSDQALCTQYIIFDPQGPHKPAVVRRGKVWSAPSTWIIDCIAAFQLLPVSDPQYMV
ncbi:BRCA1-associated RING domain protein 1 [Echeneis naucrates]|uniref:BRCA1-associated RING domain protein 1 n=1 Tax=Echeneis naucrates TaxID=173247 RepID=UPI001113E283|nr:BRCA1-associated RING domain protein 1 [Echeneis naucrates]